MLAKILVPVRGDGKGDNVLAHAAALAKRYGSHISVTHCRATAQDLLPYGVPIPSFLRRQIEQQATQLAEQEEETLVGELKELCRTLGLSFDHKASADMPTVSWTEEPGKQTDVIKHHGRLADLVAVAQPDRAQNLGFNTLKSALFNTGRPVLMCPPADQPPKTLGERVVVAWNGSLEASRAVALSMGVIEKADEVVILTGGSGELHGPSGEELCDYLQVRGVTARLENFQVRDSFVSGLMAKVGELGSDLLIMGAYGDSHEREVLFGGNTQSVVDSVKMPVIMVH